MNPESISLWADIAAIFVLINVFILMLIPGAAFGFGWWYLRKGRKALVVPLLMAQVYALRVQQITMKVTDGIANVPIQISATATQIATTLKVLKGSIAQLYREW
jgi:hypothetical protein